MNEEYEEVEREGEKKVAIKPKEVIQAVNDTWGSLRKETISTITAAKGRLGSLDSSQLRLFRGSSSPRTVDEKPKERGSSVSSGVEVVEVSVGATAAKEGKLVIPRHGFPQGS